MIKINRLEIENVKKIKATKIIPANSGLTVIGGKILCESCVDELTEEA
ncbi:MAG: hypothetical protein ACLVML_00630 [Candidatus Gastranaerophilaceae bacterium]